MATRATIFDVEVKESSIEGCGVFATREFKMGELIGVISGVIPEVPDEDCQYSINYDAGSESGFTHPEFALEPFWPFKYLNHSKDCNAGGQFVFLYALKDIKAGEEITFNYGDAWE